MSKKKNDINQILLKARNRSVKQAIDVAARTGTSLVVSRNGRIVQIKPPYKYIRVSTEKNKKNNISAHKKQKKS